MRNYTDTISVLLQKVLISFGCKTVVSSLCLKAVDGFTLYQCVCVKPLKPQTPFRGILQQCYKVSWQQVKCVRPNLFVSSSLYRDITYLHTTTCPYFGGYFRKKIVIAYVLEHLQYNLYVCVLCFESCYSVVWQWVPMFWINALPPILL